MGKPRAKGEPSEMDEMLDEFRATGTEDEPGKVEASAEPEPSTEPATEPKPAEPEKLAEEEPAEPVAAKEPEPEPEEPESSPSPEPTRTAEQIVESETSLRNKVVELRDKLRRSEAAKYAPSPLQPDASAVPPPHVPPTGQPGQGAELENMIVFRDGQADIDPEKFANAVRQATAPTPAAIAAQKDEQLRTSFVAEAVTPEARQAHVQALGRTEQAAEHLSLALRVKAGEYGVSIDQMSYDQVMGFLRQSGTLDEIGAAYPDVAPDLPHIFLASAMGSTEAMSGVLRGYVARNAQPAPALGTDVPVRSGTAPLQTPPVNRPPSLADVGSQSPAPVVGDEARLNALDQEYTDNPMAFGPEKRAELAKLEKRFS